MQDLGQDGGCRCGRVRFRIKSKPLLTLACHCTGCQQMTASAFSLGALQASGEFELLQGNLIPGGLHGSSRHMHCAHCLSWIFTLPASAVGVLFMRPTMLDNAQSFAPYAEFSVSEKLPWVRLPTNYSFDGFPSDEEFSQLLLEYKRRDLSEIPDRYSHKYFN